MWYHYFASKCYEDDSDYFTVLRDLGDQDALSVTEIVQEKNRRWVTERALALAKNGIGTENDGDWKAIPMDEFETETFVIENIVCTANKYFNG